MEKLKKHFHEYGMNSYVKGKRSKVPMMPCTTKKRFKQILVI